MKIKNTTIKLTFAYTLNYSQELLQVLNTLPESLDFNDLEHLARYFLFQLKESEYTDENSCVFLGYYLRRIAKDAAKLVCSQLKNSPNPKLHYQSAEVKDFAQKLAQPILILKNFDLDSESSIEDYARRVLVNLIKNQIVKQLNSSALTNLSDLEIMLNITISQLKEALSKYGLEQEETINCYCATWLAFRELSIEFFPHTSPVERSVPKALNELQLSKIASRCNQLLLRSSILTFILVDSDQVAHILSVCASALRNYQQL